ncbi:hypothetical protein INR49_021027 [Caranx melampygus]|nr:hypothetical protein INR49_021027 [Caranx melampygus]
MHFVVVVVRMKLNPKNQIEISHCFFLQLCRFRDCFQGGGENYIFSTGTKEDVCTGASSGLISCVREPGCRPPAPASALGSLHWRRCGHKVAAAAAAHYHHHQRRSISVWECGGC